MSSVAAGGPVEATEAWFSQHGLAYFVPERRAAVRAALGARRIIPLLVLVGLAAAAAAGALA